MGKTASARKRKGPSFAFPNCVSKKLKDDELRRTSVFKRLLDEHVLVFTWSEIVLLFISFHFFFLKERKKRNGLLVVTRTLSSTERQKKKQRSRQSSHKFAAVHYYYYFLHFCFLGALPLEVLLI